MFENIVSSLIKVFVLMKENALPALMVVGGLWGIHVLNFLMKYRLNSLGLTPRRIRGIPGIIFSPFLHGSFTHLFFNAIPLFVLLDFILMWGLHFSIVLTEFIILVSGGLLWLFGRRGVHIGASGVIMGYLAYLLVNAYEHPSVKSVIVGIICAYYFGGLLFSIFPKEEKTSWEGHLCGFMAGLLAIKFSGFLAK